jgi:hypothetical protein
MLSIMTELLDLFLQKGAVLEGHFLLTSRREKPDSRPSSAR